VIDDEVDGKVRVYQLWITALARHFVSQRGEIGYHGDAGEVLEEYACGEKREFAIRDGVSAPSGEGTDVILRDGEAIDAAEEVLEDNTNGEREAVDVAEAELGEALQPVVGEFTEPCL
jgi:hypothetical protein